MSKKKIFFMITMTFILCIMTLGYAALQERIDVEVQADIDSTYRVEITSVAEDTTVGDARSVSVASYTNDSNNMTATFNVGLTNTTDYITYSLTITNYSTVDVKLNDVEIVKTNNNMKENKIGVNNGDIILAGGTKTFTVKIKLETATSSEQTGTITVSPKITRLKGGTGNVVEEVYDEYEIGDIISFAGSNWYVIEDSGTSQDYVVLLKQNILTGIEIGSSYVKGGDTSNKNMAYYWSSICHHAQTYGTDTYNSSDYSGCSGYNDYAVSKIKEVVDNYMTTNNMTNNLKEIDGYKIRLITVDELVNNLGCSSNNSSCTSSSNASWIYSSSIDCYWTMTPAPVQNPRVWLVYKDGRMFNYYGVYDISGGVRPVINLYKNAI